MMHNLTLLQKKPRKIYLPFSVFSGYMKGHDTLKIDIADEVSTDSVKRQENLKTKSTPLLTRNRFLDISQRYIENRFLRYQTLL